MCDQVQEAIAAGEEADADHLASCAACCGITRAARRASELRGETAARLSPGFRARMMAGGKARFARRRRRQRTFAALGAAAAAGALWVALSSGETSRAAQVSPPVAPAAEESTFAPPAAELAALLAPAGRWDQIEEPLAPYGRLAGSIEGRAGELGLSDAQLAQIRALADAGKKQEIALRAQMEVIEVDLERELTRAAPDEGAVAGWADKLGALEGAVRKSRLLTWVKMRKLLSPAQRKKLESPGDTKAAVATGAKVGSLRINATPWATITIDGRAVGETPLMSELEPGVHRVRAEHPGYTTVTRSVVVVPGQSVDLMLALDAAGGSGTRLQRTDISNGIAGVRDKVKACGRKHAFSGTAAVTVVIAADGRPSSVSLDTGTPPFRDCIVRAVRAARFPRAADVTTVHYPFVFR
jgi:Spy/CpxP family protein refolding chaperone